MRVITIVGTLGVVALGVGCSASAPPPPAPMRPMPAGDCPRPDQVFVVERSADAWRLPLARVDGEAAPTPPAAPPTLWILGDDGATCRATAGEPYDLVHEEQGDVETIAGVELVADCPGDDGDTRLAIAATHAPRACTFTPPAEVAARLGTTRVEDRRVVWSPPASPIALPAPVEAALPLARCVSPGCQMLYRVERAGPAWQVSLTYLDVGAPEAICDWSSRRRVLVFVEAADGGLRPVPQADEYPRHLVGVFGDARGPRLLVQREVGWYAVSPIAADGTVTAGKEMRWYSPSYDEAPEWPGLGPTCS